MITETRSAFGEVLAKLMEKRGIAPTPGNMFELAADAGLDPGEFMTRVAGSMDAHAGSLTGLADLLEFDTPEKEALAIAYTYEQRRASSCYTARRAGQHQTVPAERRCSVWFTRLMVVELKQSSPKSTSSIPHSRGPNGPELPWRAKSMRRAGVSLHWEPRPLSLVA